MPLQFRMADEQDLDELTAMNRALIRDEQSRNPLGDDALRLRMSGFLREGWQVAVLELDGQIVGYALFQERTDEYDTALKYVYLRQYFVRLEFRRKGLGREGVRLLRECAFPAGAEVAIDVLELNRTGRAFWEGIGFKPHLTHMKLAPATTTAGVEQNAPRQIAATTPGVPQNTSSQIAVNPVAMDSAAAFEPLLAQARAVVRRRRLSDDAEAGSVGAALLGANGRIYTGVCIDTACSMGFCAEHAAAAAMVTDGEHRVLRMVAVGDDGTPLPPCGRCREFISQLHPGNGATEVLVRAGTVVPLKKLLPHDWRE